MTEQEAKAKLTEWLLDQVGYIGKKSNAKLEDKTANIRGLYTKYAAELDSLGYYNGRKNGYDYCAVFANDAYLNLCKNVETNPAKLVALAQKLVGQPPKSMGAACKYSYNYYKQAGQATSEPEVGNQIFFRYAVETGHTGIVYKVTSSYVYTVEGNVNGGEVQAKKYAKTNKYIEGYGRPKWSLITKAGSDPAPAPAPRPVLRFGSKGTAVKQLQETLLSLGYKLPIYGADSDFGSETERAVKVFQRDHALEVDGIVGPMTWAALDAAVEASGKAQHVKDNETGQDYLIYTVRKGDTLSKIAAAHRTSTQTLKFINGIKDANLIQVGQKIRIPV